MCQSQQVTSTPDLAQTVSTLQKYNTDEFLNSYIFLLIFWVSKTLPSVLLPIGFIIQIRNNLQTFRIRRLKEKGASQKLYMNKLTFLVLGVPDRN